MSRGECATEQLLPCPHCGNAKEPCFTDAFDLYGEDHDGPAGWFVTCNASNEHDGCGSATGYCATKAEALAAWNKRAAVSETAPPVCELEETRKILQKACDRTWKDETLYQTAVIASNAIYWRDREIENLKRDRDARAREACTAEGRTGCSFAVSARAAPAWKRGDQRVVCAAMRDKAGRIITGARHYDSIMMEQVRRDTDGMSWRAAEQGFIDQFGKFLTREEARLIAEAQGQILDPNGGGPVSLYSENLY